MKDKKLTVNDLYYEFTVLINKNSENRNVNIDKANFSYLYNMKKDVVLRLLIDSSNSTDKNFYLNCLYADQVLSGSIEEDAVSLKYELPKDYFHVMVGRGYTFSKGTCSTKPLSLEYSKTNQANSFLSDKYRRTSKTWNRVMADIYGCNLVLFKESDSDEFFNVNFHYIKKINPIYFAGEPDVDGCISQSDSEIVEDEMVVRAVLDAVVNTVHQANENQFGYQSSAVSQALSNKL